MLVFALNTDPLDLIEAHLIPPPVIELRRAAAGMVGHRPRFFQRTAVIEIGGNAGSPEGVIGRLGQDADRRRHAAADHIIGVLLGRERVAELASAFLDRTKQITLRLGGQPAAAACVLMIARD